jgi:phosphoglycerate kinase
MSSKLTIVDIKHKLYNKCVLIRVDYNVPLINGVITDKTRIFANLSTLDYVFLHGASKVVLMSHLGRPNGKVIEKYSLKPIVPILEKYTGRNIQFISTNINSDDIQTEISNTPNGSIILLENLRFYSEEENYNINDLKVLEFCNNISKFGDIYVNDAFGTAHRSHSSIVGINLPIRVSGLLLSKEINYLYKSIDLPQRPFLAIVGGAKVSDKIPLLYSLISKVDEIIIGGGMAFTFKKIISNMKIGSSIFDSKGAEMVRSILDKAKLNGVKIHLPVDFVCADNINENANITIVDDIFGIPDGFYGLDCGPYTRKINDDIIKQARLIVWNGPQGMFEISAFAAGSHATLYSVVNATANGAISIIGGGDTASIVEQTGLTNAVSHVSTGGGATLELLEGKILPGITALTNK